MENEGVSTIWDLIQDKRILAITPTGSYEICNPKPDPITDIDIVVLTEQEKSCFDDDWTVDSIQAHIERCGFEISSDESYEFDGEECVFPFDCYRAGTINLIVTHSVKFFNRWKIATKICKEKNVLDKEERIVIFQLVLYGE